MRVALEILCDFLQTLGFSVVTASCGSQALDILSQWKNRGHNLDLVPMDWKMPDMDGIETANSINSLFAPAELPVIIMTTVYNRDDVLDIARQSGIRNVITKPPVKFGLCQRHNQATRQIRALPQFKDLPIVAMTAHAMAKDRELSLAAGMNDHINKPINIKELFTSLAKWLKKT